MKKVLLFLWVVCLISILFGVSFSAEVDFSKKLGFGFRPGEVEKLKSGIDYVPGELIVAYYEDRVTISELEAMAKSFGGTKKKEIRGAVLIKFASEEALLNAAKSLAKDPRVRFVERNGIMRIPPKPDLNNIEKGINSQRSDMLKEKLTTKDFQPAAVSTDPATFYQWHLTVIRKTTANTTISNPPTVAVIDTGVDYTHPDLSGKVIKGINCLDGSMDPYDDHGHGTHVAGIIAAKANNNQYGEGVCDNCKILAIKVLTSAGWGTFFDVACGMQYARTAQTDPPTKVINMSLGSLYDSNLIHEEVIAIKNAGKILVAAAGNDGEAWEKYPAAYPETAFRVMATEQNDCRAWFSNFSPPDNSTLYNIAAPGYMIPSITPDGGFEAWSGTSMATPVVSGVVALVWGNFPSMSRDEIISRILNNAQPINCGFPGYTTKRVDLRRALTGGVENRVVIGRLLDPFTGKPPTPPLANAKVFYGTTQLGNDTISRDGFYEINLSGNETTGLSLKASKTGYVTSKLRDFNLASGKITGPFTDAFPKIRDNHATITLDWKTWQPSFADWGGYCNSSCLGWELDLYVKTPSGAYIYWGSPGSLTQPPYVYFPRDSYKNEPLETIVISPQASDGEYIVFIENIGDGDSWNNNWTGSQASVQVFSSGTQKAYYKNPPSTCGTNTYWIVGKIIKSGTTYTWQSLNYCSNTRP